MIVKTVEAHRSSLGIDANIAVLIAYLAGVVIGWIPTAGILSWLAPLILFILEKESGFVRFHAMQSFLLNVVGLVFGIIIAFLAGAFIVTSFYAPFAGFGMLGLVGLLTMIVSIVILIFAVISIINGYQYKEYRIPIIGNFAAALTEKFKGALMHYTMTGKKSFLLDCIPGLRQVFPQALIVRAGHFCSAYSRRLCSLKIHPANTRNCVNI